MECKMIYFARPIVGITEKQKEQIRMVEAKCFDLICGKTTIIYDPANLRIPNAWNISEEAWAQSVFTMDIHYLDKARAMVLLDFGRGVGGGAYWEAGYAYGHMPIIVVRMPDVKDSSLMVRCSATQFFTYDEFLQVKNVDFFVDKINKGKACVLN